MKTVTVDQMDNVLRDINRILASLDKRITALEEAKTTTRKPATTKEDA